MNANKTRQVSERFFADMENDIRTAFTFNSDLFNEKTQAMLTQIKHNEHAVSLHIRRGDYLEPKHWKTTGSVCQLPYYLNAITEMNKRIEQPSYYRPSSLIGIKVRKAGRT